jgi:putative addiction module killer protein
MKINVIRTKTLAAWLAGLKDRRAAARVTSRILRIEDGNFGDTKSVGDGVHELRIDHGPGYRVYFIRRGEIVVVLLCGGDKSTQSRDIDEAKRLARQWKDKFL